MAVDWELQFSWENYCLPRTGADLSANRLYGWALLENINGTVQLLDSALVYGGGGIYAGTQTIIPVPEPSDLGLLALGGLFLGWRWRKSSRA